MKGPWIGSELDALIAAAKSDAPDRALVEQICGLATPGNAPSTDVSSWGPAKSSVNPAASGGAVNAAVSGAGHSALLGFGGALKAGMGVAAVAVAVMSSAIVMHKATPNPDRPRSQGDRPAQRAEPAPVAQVERPEDREQVQTLPLPPPLMEDRPAPSSDLVKTEPRLMRKARSGPTNKGQPEDRGQGIAAELGMIDEARRALRSNAARALALTERCAEEFPSGAAATERNVIAIEALVRLGRAQEARARLETFEAVHPSSFHLPYLRRLVMQDGR